MIMYVDIMKMLEILNEMRSVAAEIVDINDNTGEKE